MMKTEITPEAAKALLVAKLAKESAHIADLVRWGAWTLVADYAEAVAADARAVRAIEQLPAPEAELFSTATRDTQQNLFSSSVFHHSAVRDLPAAAAKPAGSVIFGGLR